MALPFSFLLDDIPSHDKAVSHVWQNDRGYLFNVIRAKLKAYKHRDQGSIYNKDLPGPGNEGLLLVDDMLTRKVGNFIFTRSVC